MRRGKCMECQLVRSDVVRNGEWRGEGRHIQVCAGSVKAITPCGLCAEAGCESRVESENYRRKTWHQEEGTLLSVGCACSCAVLDSMPPRGGLARDDHHGVRQREAPEHPPTPLARSLARLPSGTKGPMYVYLASNDETARPGHLSSDPRT